jgi:hypothetical protein
LPQFYFYIILSKDAEGLAIFILKSGQIINNTSNKMLWEFLEQAMKKKARGPEKKDSGKKGGSKFWRL